MNCENVNLKELLKKAEEYDELKENRDYWFTQYKEKEDYWKKEDKKNTDKLESICKFLSQLCQGKYEELEIWRFDVVEQLPEIFKMIADEKKQGFLLAEERRENYEKFQEELNRLEEIYNRKAEELDFAWQKFRQVKTSRHQQTIDEINAEKI
jgi:hypothetical protein